VGILGLQRRVWAFSGPILRFLTDYDGGALSTRFRQHGASCRTLIPCSAQQMGKFPVLWFIRSVEPRVIDDRPERDPDDHQQVGKQLGRFPVLVCALYLRKSRHLVLCRRAEREMRSRQVGCGTPWGQRSVLQALKGLIGCRWLKEAHLSDGCSVSFPDSLINVKLLRS